MLACIYTVLNEYVALAYSILLNTNLCTELMEHKIMYESGKDINKAGEENQNIFIEFLKEETSAYKI